MQIQTRYWLKNQKLLLLKIFKITPDEDIAVSEKSNMNQAKKDLVTRAKVSMLHRRFYNYSVADFSYNLLCCYKKFSCK